MVWSRQPSVKNQGGSLKTGVHTIASGPGLWDESKGGSVRKTEVVGQSSQ
jgi:hypothetical protein